jgi:hypothetical protein
LEALCNCELVVMFLPRKMVMNEMAIEMDWKRHLLAP